MPTMSKVSYIGSWVPPGLEAAKKSAKTKHRLFPSDNAQRCQIELLPRPPPGPAGGAHGWIPNSSDVSSPQQQSPNVGRKKGMKSDVFSVSGCIHTLRSCEMIQLALDGGQEGPPAENEHESPSCAEDEATVSSPSPVFHVIIRLLASGGRFLIEPLNVRITQALVAKRIGGRTLCF